MKRCVIFCAARCDSLLQPIREDDFVIAADGGLEHTRKFSIEPDEILGDFDSLGFVPEDSRVFPVEKDDTDAMLAVRRGLELGYREFLLYGSLDGPRLDHTVANLQTLLFLTAQGASGHLIGKDYLVSSVRDGVLSFPATATGIVSVFCLDGRARGVTIRGLQYSLEQGTLESSYPLGVSNHFQGKPATVRVDDGTLLVVYDVANGFCTGESL